MRLDLQSALVVVAATASALTASYWLSHLDGQRTAQAAPVAALAEPNARTGAAQILKAADGHFWAEARIDGRAVRVLVDTGASVVALTRQDAARLGLRPTADDFTRTVRTASGQAKAAPVVLEAVSIGAARVEGVEALVVEAGLEQSLLGMSYLGRLSGFEASADGLILRP